MFKPALAACMIIAASTFPASAEKNEHHTMEKPTALLSVQSQNDFEATLAKLKTAIDTRGFKTFAVIDHAKGAASIDETLRPTTLVIFGNPKGGTPLMQAEQTLGLELPLKILVAEREGGAVKLYYTDMAALFAEYSVTGQDKRLGAIKGALDTIAAEAAGQ